MSIVNGRLPIKVTSAKFIDSAQFAIAGFLLTNVGAAAVGQATIQDGQNNDIAALNTTATNGIAEIFFPNPISCNGLSVTSLTGSGAVLYIYLADV
jgi:hypothetical protein